MPFNSSKIGAAVIAPAAGALHGLYLGESGFPESQDMLGNIELLSRFTDCAECFR